MALYILWFVTTALTLAGAWGVLVYMRRREAYHHSIVAILHAPLEADDFSGQAQALCEVCTTEAAASGCSNRPVRIGTSTVPSSVTSSARI